MSLIRATNHKFSIVDFQLLKWNITYNSLSFVEVELIFNTDLNTVDSEYATATGFSNSGIKVNIIQGASQFMLVRVGTPYTYSYSSIGDQFSSGNSGVSKIKPINSAIKFRYLYTEQSNVVLSNLSDCTLKIILHDNNSTWEREFNLGDIQDVSGLNNRTTNIFRSFDGDLITTSGTLDLIGTTNHVADANGVYFESGDALKFVVKNQTSGISSNSISSINNTYIEPTLETITPFYYGKIWTSRATFGFSHVTIPTTDFILNIDNTSKIRSILTKGTTNKIKECDYSSLMCKIDNDIDGLMLLSEGTFFNYNMYIPVLKNIATYSNGLTIAFADSVIANVPNNLLSLSSGGTVSVPSVSTTSNNGLLSFTINYQTFDAMLNGGTATGKVFIKSNDFSFYSNVSFDVNDSPELIIATPANNSYIAYNATDITITSTPQDDHDIDLVQFSVDTIGNIISTENNPTSNTPFNTTWTVSGLSTGSHILIGRVYDEFGSFSDTNHTITKLVRPAVNLLSPTDGDIQHNTNSILLQAQVVMFGSSTILTDSTINTVIFLNNSVTNIGSGVYNSGTQTWSVNWNTPPTGTHSITARVTDKAGIVADSTVVSYKVNTIPTVSITSTVSSGTSGQNIIITATANDNDTLTLSNVEFFVNNISIGVASGGSTPTFTINHILGSIGTYQITAKVTDIDSQITTSAIHNINVT